MSIVQAPAALGHWSVVAAYAGLALALAAAYADPLATLVRQWLSHDRYSFGLLIPVLSGYLAWSRRDRLRDLTVKPSGIAGSLVLIAALALLVAGRAAAVQIVQQLSFVLTLAGLVLLVLGSQAFLVLALPLAYLLLMVPVWEVLTNPLHPPFQRFSAEVGTVLLRALGIPAYREGNTIELPGVVLDVAESCSGVNYLLAVVAIGVPLAMLFLEGWRRRVLLLAFASTIAIASNALRVALIGLLALYGPRALSHGPFHVLQGLSVAAVGYGALFLGLRVLARGARGRRQPASGALGSSGALRAATRASPGAIWWATALLAVAIVAGLGRPEPVPLARPLADLPMRIGRWQGRDVAPSVVLFRHAGVDAELARVYEAPSGARVELYIAYFERQSQGRELGSEQVVRAMPRESVVALPAGPGRAIDVARTRLALRQGARQGWYWFDVNGRIVTDAYRLKLLSAKEALLHRRSNGAVVLLLGGDQATSDDRPLDPTVADFASAFVPLVPALLSRR